MLTTTNRLLLLTSFALPTTTATRTTTTTPRLLLLQPSNVRHFAAAATKPKKDAAGAGKKKGKAATTTSRKQQKAGKGMTAAPSVPMNKEVFGRIVLEESRRFAAMKNLSRQGTSKDEREVALRYAKEMTKRNNKFNWAWETRAALRDAAIAALPTEELRQEAKTPLKNPLFPLSLVPASWTPPTKT